MRDAMKHRGPDGQGSWATTCDGWTVGFAHTRLAILDLSDAGLQPMRRGSDRLCITYNGEVYNFEDLRDELAGSRLQFSSRTDTEVVLAAYEQWSVGALARLRGMFAFGLWDETDRTLLVARDPLGIKPLYYYSSADTFVFASEVRALLASGLVPRHLDSEGVASYLSWGSVEAPQTIIRGVQSLLPGCYLKIVPSAGGLRVVQDSFAPAYGPPGPASREEAVPELRKVLKDSVRRHLISDVPVGVFLSGGLDSTAVVALASEVSEQPLRTFTVTFTEQEYSESAYARSVASRFGTVHQELCLRENDLLSMLPQALSAMDQPTMDGTNTYVVSKAVRDAGVPVALSGLGGDELFAGYASFRRARQLRMIANVPRKVRAAVAACGRTVMNGSVADGKFWRLLESEAGPGDAYAVSRQLFSAPEVRAFTSRSPHASGIRSGNADVLNAVSELEMSGYMANTLLRDTDFMSMSHSLEVRVPFVDSAVVAYVLSLPGKWKLESHRPKPLLLDALGSLVPDSVWKRPKMGFTFPFRKWLMGELRPQMDAEFASDERLSAAGLDPSACRAVWRNFQRDPDSVRWSRPWSLYVLSQWCALNRVTP